MLRNNGCVLEIHRIVSVVRLWIHMRLDVMPQVLVITRLRCIVRWNENGPEGFESHLVKEKSFLPAYQKQLKNPDLRMFPSGVLMNFKSEQWLVHRRHSPDADRYQGKSKGADYQADGHQWHIGIKWSQRHVWNLICSSPSGSAVIFCKSP